MEKYLFWCYQNIQIQIDCGLWYKLHIFEFMHTYSPVIRRPEFEAAWQKAKGIRYIASQVDSCHQIDSSCISPTPSVRPPTAPPGSRPPSPLHRNLQKKISEKKPRSKLKLIASKKAHSLEKRNFALAIIKSKEICKE